MMRIITSPTLLEDLSQLDPLLATEGWNTLMTFTRETGCMFFLPSVAIFPLSDVGQPLGRCRRRREMKISRRRFSTRSQLKKLLRGGTEETVEDPAPVSGSVLIVLSRTRIVVLIVRFAAYHCSKMKHVNSRTSYNQ